jgi:predicted MFS family arabinose efflux permease
MIKPLSEKHLSKQKNISTSEKDNGRMQKQQKKNNNQLALLGAAHSLNHSFFVIASPLLTLIMLNLGTTKFIIGTISTIASFIYGTGSLIGGPLGDKIGEAKTITLCLTFSGLSTLIMLIAGATNSISIYTFALITIAAFASLYHPTANSLISKTFNGKIAETMGWHGVGGTLGVVLTPTAAWLIGATFGWAWAFATFGTLSILVALLFLKYFTKTNTKNNNGGTIINALKIRQLWTLLTFNIAIGLFMKGVELYFPTYLTDNRQISQAWASVAYTLLLAAGVPAQWLGGKTADKIGSKKVLIATSTGICLSFLSLLLFPIYIVGITLFILLYGLSFYAHQPALNYLAGLLSPQEQRGAVYGIFFFTSFGVGSISQAIAGYIGDAYGLDAAFYLLTAFALAALILSLKLPEKRENK